MSVFLFCVFFFIFNFFSNVLVISVYHVQHSLLIFVHYYYLLGLLTTVTFTNLLLHARLLLLFNKLYCIVVLYSYYGR